MFQKLPCLVAEHIRFGFRRDSALEQYEQGVTERVSGLRQFAEGHTPDDVLLRFGKKSPSSSLTKVLCPFSSLLINSFTLLHWINGAAHHANPPGCCPSHLGE